ncbi:MAG: phospholipase, partial [Actinobacteria bacterium]|nr:phospholipase [Actinomycetota bacterium]NIW28715.1 phospholipase [Actinomycetota bacterium]NIX20003.1 phospholipase [Actinomycetota bacterium]NIX50055.1 phospholipase [Actinomycetota bacterium]
GGQLLQTGPSLDEAAAAVVLVHGRGGSAGDILTLASEIDVPGIAWLAPQAAGNTWYPLSFLAPHARNEPGLSSGLGLLAGIV